MRMRQAHFPGRAPIDAYGNGGFRFAEMSHKGSILIVPSGIYGWEVTEAGGLTPGAFARVFEEETLPELLLLGTGHHLVLPDTKLRLAFRERGIGLEPMDTGAAARTYNVLLAEERLVAAALIAVE